MTVAHLGLAVDVKFAALTGTSVDALCGAARVPFANARDLPLCDACKAAALIRFGKKEAAT